MTDIARSITDKLAELGDDADSIAAKLLELGITGRHEGNSCPLAHYLTRDIPQVSWVGEDDIEYNLGMWAGAGARERVVDLPAPAREFVARFDKGEYPDLDVTL